MRNFTAIALGLLLLVSSAAAQGNNNIATVTVDEVTTGLLVTGANIIQTSDLEANLLGNTIVADQIAALTMADSDFAGNFDGKTNAIQIADMIINDTGNLNVDSQLIELVQGENEVAIGNITQIGVQEIDNIGNENTVDQSTIAVAGVSVEVGLPNLLTNSELWQVSSLDAYVKGNTNLATQVADQLASDNNLVNSLLYEQIIINAEILGNENNLEPLAIQAAIQTAAANDLVGSRADQLVFLDEQIVGNANDVFQSAGELFSENSWVTSTASQAIDEKARSLGNNNTIDHSAELSSIANQAVGGRLMQTVDIETNT